jgi:type I restriction enzyme S subunit
MTEQKPGLLGSSAIIPEGRKYLHNQRLGLIIQLNEECLDKGYLYHLFNYGQVRDEISRTSTGSKVKHTSPHRIREIVAPIPTLGEQREIAAVLDAIDRKIDLHRRKRAVLNELFKVLLHTLMVGKIRVGDLDLSALTPARMAEAAQ